LCVILYRDREGIVKVAVIGGILVRESLTHVKISEPKDDK